MILVQLVVDRSEIGYWRGFVVERHLGAVVVGGFRHSVATDTERIMFLQRTGNHKAASAQDNKHKEGNPGDDGPAPPTLNRQCWRSYLDIFCARWFPYQVACMP